MSLRVYDAQGRLVRILADGRQPAGNHRALWDSGQERGGRAPRGIYFARFESGAIQQTKKIVLLD